MNSIKPDHVNLSSKPTEGSAIFELNIGAMWLLQNVLRFIFIVLL